MKKLFIFLASMFLLSACSTEKADYQWTVTYDKAQLNQLTKCLKDAGIPTEVKGRWIYIPEKYENLAVINCS